MLPTTLFYQLGKPEVRRKRTFLLLSSIYLYENRKNKIFEFLIWIKFEFIIFFKNVISLKTIPGESEAVATEITAPCNETTLPKSLSNCELDEIFNADEFGFFTNVCRIKFSACKQKNGPGVKKIKSKAYR